MSVDILRKAQKLIASGKLTRAESLCTKLIKQDPHQIDALHLLGIIALNRQQFDKAIQTFSQLLKIRPDHAIDHYNLGLAYHSSGKNGNGK